MECFTWFSVFKLVNDKYLTAFGSIVNVWNCLQTSIKFLNKSLVFMQLMIFSQISFGSSVFLIESILSLLLIGSISESSFGLFSPLGNSLRFLVKFCRFSWKFHDLDETGYFLHNFTKFFSVALKIKILFLNTKVCRCYQNVEIIELGSCSVDQVTPIMVKDVVKSKFFLP